MSYFLAYLNKYKTLMYIYSGFVLAFLTKYQEKIRVCGFKHKTKCRLIKCRDKMNVCIL